MQEHLLHWRIPSSGESATGAVIVSSAPLLVILESAVLVAAVLTIYMRSIHGTFCFDDLLLMDTLNGDRNQWRELMKRKTRPISWASFALNVRWFGPTYTGFHVLNVALHLASVFSLWWVAGLLLPAGSAFLAAVIFAVHPLAVSSVAYITGRGAVLGGLFAILAMGCMLSGWAPIAVVFLALACLSKEDYVVLTPLLMMAGWIYSIPWFWLPAVPAILTLIFQWHQFARLFRHTGEVGIQQSGFPDRLPSPAYQFSAFTDLIESLPLWTFGFYQCADPDVRKRGKLAALYAAGAAAFFFFVFSFSPITMTAGLWILVSPMLIYVLLPMPDSIMEYRAYFVVPGMALLLVAMFPAWILALMAGWFIANAYHRSGHYKNAEAYWKSCIADGGRVDRALINLGCCARENGLLAKQQKNPEREAQHLAEARSYFHRALAHNPKLAQPRSNLAVMDSVDGKWDEAIAGMQLAVAYNPTFHEGWYALGTFLESQARFPEAIDAYTQAFLIFNDAKYANRLGLMAMREDHKETALGWFMLATTHAKDWIDCRYNQAMCLKILGRMDEAIPVFKTLPKTMNLTPEMIAVHQ